MRWVQVNTIIAFKLMLMINWMMIACDIDLWQVGLYIGPNIHVALGNIWAVANGSLKDIN